MQKKRALKKDILHHDHGDDFKVVSPSNFNSCYCKKLGYHLKEAVNVGIKQHCKYVFTKVMHTNHGSNIYDIPGGKRKLGEHSESCAICETEEEASLSLTVDVLTSSAWAYDVSQVNMYFYIHAEDILKRLESKK